MTTRWIVGLDLGRTGDGALGFAKWFTGAGGAIGLHALEEEHLLYVLRDHHLDEVLKGAAEALRRRVEGAGAAATFGALRVVQAVHAEEALEEARAAEGAEGLIVGRAASGGVVRLGRVARRLLRTLESPVVVVPPDLAPAPGTGPVIAMTNLQADSAGACAFAEAAAARLGRKWILLHVARALEAEYLPLDARTRAEQAHRAAAREGLDRWVKEHGLAPDRVVAEVGAAVEVASEVARREGSPLVVTGSRRLSTAERTFQASLGSALAASSPVPVAVVPPPGPRAA